MAYYDDQDYGVDPNGNPRQRSRISSFAADGRGNFSSTFFGPETGGAMVRRDWGADFDPQAQVGADFDGIAQRAAAVKRHNAQLGNWSLNAAMKSALGNGGRMPQNQVDLLTRNLGMDGRNRAVWRAGFLQNGDFAVDVAERGQNGGVSTTTMRIPRADQRRMMLDAPGVWGDAGVARYRELGDALSSTLGRSELGDPEAYSGALQRYRSGQSARQAQAAEANNDAKIRIEAAKLYAEAEKRGETLTPASLLKSLTPATIGLLFPKRYAKDAEGKTKMIEAEDGSQRPEEMPYTQDEVMSILQNVINQSKGGEDVQGDGDRKSEIMSILGLAPQPVDPRAKEMQDRQMEDALDAQRRSEVTRFPQRYIRYRDASGREVAANGYVTNDGRVYDANGYEIEGATAARSPYDNALPPIRALDGGRQPAQTPASAAQEQGVQTPEQLAQAALAKRRPSVESPAETPVAAAEQPAEKPAYQQNFEQMTDPATGVVDPVRAAETMSAQASAPVEQKPKTSEQQSQGQSVGLVRETTPQDDSIYAVNLRAQYSTLPKDLVQRLREAIPEMGEQDVLSGKYDKQIEALGKRIGWEDADGFGSRVEVLRRNADVDKKAADLRSKRRSFARESKVALQALRDEVEQNGTANGWDQKTIDAEIDRRTRGLLSQLRDKYGLPLDASGD